MYVCAYKIYKTRVAKSAECSYYPDLDITNVPQKFGNFDILKLVSGNIQRERKLR